MSYGDYLFFTVEGQYFTTQPTRKDGHCALAALFSKAQIKGKWTITQEFRRQLFQELKEKYQSNQQVKQMVETQFRIVYKNEPKSRIMKSLRENKELEKAFKALDTESGNNGENIFAIELDPYKKIIDAYLDQLGQSSQYLDHLIIFAMCIINNLSVRYFTIINPDSPSFKINCIDEIVIPRSRQNIMIIFDGRNHYQRVIRITCGEYRDLVLKIKLAQKQSTPPIRRKPKAQKELPNKAWEDHAMWHDQLTEKQTMGNVIKFLKHVEKVKAVHSDCKGYDQLMTQYAGETERLIHLCKKWNRISRWSLEKTLIQYAKTVCRNALRKFYNSRRPASILTANRYFKNSEVVKLLRRLYPNKNIDALWQKPQYEDNTSFGYTSMLTMGAYY